MVIKNSVISAIRALKRNKVRTVLTSLGVIIGILSVVALYGIGSSAKIAISSRVFTYGINTISVWSLAKSFETRDLEELKNLIPQVKYITPILMENTMHISYKREYTYSRVYGVTNDYFAINGWDLDDGSFFSKEELFSNEKVVVIGQTIKKELFGNENPLNKPILLNKKPYTIVGTLKGKGRTIAGKDLDKILITPYTTFGIRVLGKRTFNIIWLATESETQLDETQKMVIRYFKQYHNLELSEKFLVTTSKEQLERAEDIINNVTILVIITAAISLIVGGIGIMNIMLVSVSERTREIGIRLAIGAKARDILTQFLVESIMLSFIGGLIGIILGLLINYIVVLLNEWVFIFSIFSVITAFSFTTIVGILFGFYPAFKASQLNPIDALRHE